MSSDTVSGKPVVGSKSSIRVIVVGDHGTGKSSLITAAASNSFPESVSSVLPPTCLPADYFEDGVPVIIIDTASSLEGKAKLKEELKRADVIVLTYACDKPETLDSLQNFWIHEIRRLKVKVPVIVVGCKLDLIDGHYLLSKELVDPIMQQYTEIEIWAGCSAAKLDQVYEVFDWAQKAVVYPIAPLYDLKSQRLSLQCERALERIFILCDHDMDMTLNDRELNELQVKCFDPPLQPSVIVILKNFVRENLPGGFNEYGLTLPGFLFFHEQLIENGQCDFTWFVLRKFGYNDDIEPEMENIPVLSREASDQFIKEQMEKYKAQKDRSASVDLVESVKAEIEAEKSQLAKMRKDIEEDHERKKLELANEHERNKAELEAMRKEIDDHRDNLVEDAVRKLIEKLPPQVTREFLTQVIIHV